MKNQSKTCIGAGDYTMLFKILAASPVISAHSDGKHVILTSGETSFSVESSDLVFLATRGFLKRSGTTIGLTPLAQSFVARGDVAISIRVKNGELRAENDDESPLSALMRHKTPDGKPFLNDRQFEAGERLRSDFTRGHIMPRVSANWQASVSSGRRAGDANGVENLTQSALAARMRVEAALQTMGQELAGVTSDICCYLKGFEQVEMERKWPKRSAKFMLRAALTVLALHYFPNTNHGSTRTHKWGSDDFRPSIS